MKFDYFISIRVVRVTLFFHLGKLNHFNLARIFFIRAISKVSWVIGEVVFFIKFSRGFNVTGCVGEVSYAKF